MSQQTLFTGLARNVGEHVVAITCVSTVELSCHAFIEKFGQDVHQWPVAAYVAVGILIYVAGFFSARFVIKRLKDRANRVSATKPVPMLDPPPTLVGPTIQTEDKYALAVITSAIILGAAAVFALRRTEPAK